MKLVRIVVGTVGVGLVFAASGVAVAQIPTGNTVATVNTR
jgi:hypothetical protein